MRYALITGASSGFGREFARELATDPSYGLILVARRAQRLEALQNELLSQRTGNSPEILWRACDLTVHKQRVELLDWVSAMPIKLDLVINNAGHGSFGQFSQSLISTQTSMAALNCEAIVHLTHGLLRAMRRPGGSIIIVSSIAAFSSIPIMAVYAATKAFDLQLALALRQELAGSGVNVHALCPGPSPTEFGEVAGVGDGFAALPGTAPAYVVREALRSVRENRAVTIPGLKNRFLAHLATLVTRPSAAAISSWLLQAAHRPRSNN